MVFIAVMCPHAVCFYSPDGDQACGTIDKVNL